MKRTSTKVQGVDRAIAVGLTTCFLLVFAALASVAGGDQDTQPRRAGASTVASEAEPSVPEGSRASAAEDPIVVVYVPPRGRGRARVTAGAGTRGNTAGLEIAALAPRDHVALTTRSQPTLYWFVSKPTATRIDVVLVDEDSIDPLLEWTVPGPVEAGIHALPLAELDLHLDPDKTYSWYVALVSDPERRANDVIAGGAIERTAAPRGIDRALEDAPFRYAPYAASGIWYDAMDELVRAIERDPGNMGLRLQRNALLEQVELDQVAVYTLGDGR